MSVRVHRVLKLSLPRLFSAPNDWISPLIVISRGLVSVSNGVPFPYVNTALAGGLALLELIQTVGQTTDDLRYLAESVVTIMKLLRQEMDSHPTSVGTNLPQVCMEFNTHLTRLSTDIEAMSKDWSSSKFKKYLKVNSVRDEITQFTRRVTDMRANATLIAATGTRMDVAGVANAVAEVQSSVLEIQNGLTVMGSTTTNPNRELIRFEEDFHALKIGDIELDFETARTSTFMRWDKSERNEIGWTDYKGYVRGSPRTIRVYEGSDPTESWKGFLSLLADCSPSPHLPQLFGFCSSPRLRSLVFHGEFRTLDEYAMTLQSPRAIVEWETTLMKDLLELDALPPHKASFNFIKARPFASVKAETGKLMIMHLENLVDTAHIVSPSNRAEPFTYWFVYADLYRMRERNIAPDLESSSSLTQIQMQLLRLKMLMRSEGSLWPPHPGLSIYQTLTARGGVYHSGNLLARLENYEPAVDVSWRALAMISVDVDGSINWPPMHQFPVMERPAETGVTHFVVPLNGRHGPWKSLYDDRPRCGYFLNAQIGFGADVPDIALAWITQSTAFITKQDARQLYVSTQTDLRLMWEMVLCQEETATTPESLSLMEILPDHLHVYVQVPIIDGRRILEPRIYWSTDATSKDTSLIPLGTFKIRMTWELVVSASTWEQHHYEVAKSVQEECGFDPATKTAAKALGIPLLKACDATSVEPCVDEEAWCRKGFEFDPHELHRRDSCVTSNN